jgi:gliding motility-associated lipoprotein GldD
MTKMQTIFKLKYLIILALICFFIGCRDSAVPKPRGYFRIDLPAKNYKLYDTLCPFMFEYPVYGQISYDVGKKSEPCWFNIEFPQNKAKIHVSFKSINNNLESILKESNDLAYSHSVKADAISEKPWQNDKDKIYGILYDIKGPAASSIQFFVTDSTRHFLRGALYFSAPPNEDSLAPVIKFFREDIVHLVETFKWKNQ